MLPVNYLKVGYIILHFFVTINVYILEESFESINSDHIKSCQFPLDVIDRLECNDCLCSPCQVC